jgi:hypothetical protein
MLDHATAAEGLSNIDIIYHSCDELLAPLDPEARSSEVTR